ncbi:MurR/RpiR family transcriptional regulator [Microbacterium lacticum]|uniref:MurR/RpiR family transcriptional regulator n=1 Tax=Microbacterium lacticum TaxID=33885 RepID=UPI002467B072|nr:MurR/RpiR family transcriptional regulator [Microbacterium lacticum]
MSASERRVAEAVLADPRVVCESTITELAGTSASAASTVARFCQRLGFDGYRQFRAAVIAALGYDDARLGEFDLGEGEIDAGDAPEEIAAKIAFQEVRAIQATMAALDLDATARAAAALGGARRIVLYGAGSSSLTAQDLCQKLARIGRPAVAETDVHLALSRAALLDADSVLVGVSSRGETRETLDVLRAARRAGATTVSITNATSSSLDDVSDVVLRSAVRESRLRSGATASRIAHLAIVDVLFVLVLRLDFPQLSESLRVTYDAVRSRRGDH